MPFQDMQKHRQSLQKQKKECGCQESNLGLLGTDCNATTSGTHRYTTTADSPS